MTGVFRSSIFYGKTALVTGTNTGIGAACAEQLAASGATVIGWERQNRPPRRSSDFEVIVGDLADTESTARTIDRLVSERPIDILINNAGTITRSPATEITPSAWRSVMATNLDAAFVISQSVGRQMLSRGAGRIIMIASLISMQGGLNIASYSASKHAIAGLTKALSNEWADRGVTVNAVAPGYVVTNNTKALREDAARYQEINARIPIGRWAEPDDIAGPVVFLCSEAARYITGHVLVVDGGWMAR